MNFFMYPVINVLLNQACTITHLALIVELTFPTKMYLCNESIMSIMAYKPLLLYALAKFINNYLSITSPLFVKLTLVS